MEAWLNDHWIFICGEHIFLSPLYQCLEDNEKLPPGVYRLEWPSLG